MRDGPPAGLDRPARWLALAGGALLVAVSLLTTASVLRRWLLGDPVPGDFELVQMGAGLAVFLALPWAQARRANILVDSFTARAPAGLVRALDAAWTLLYALAAGVIAWRLARGAAGTVASGTGTMVLGLPYGWAIAVAAAAFALVALVAAAMAPRLLRAGA